MDQMNFVGSVLSLNCGESLGTFQGEVTKVNKSQQSISLKKPYRNGVKFEVPEITIRAVDIKDLKILKTLEEQEALKQDELGLLNGINGTNDSTPDAKHRPQNSSVQKSQRRQDRSNGRTPTKQRGDGEEKTGFFSGTQLSAFQRVLRDDGKDTGSEEEKETAEDKTNKAHRYLTGNVDGDQKVRSSPRKIEGGSKQKRIIGVNARNAECFSAPVESFLATDFDFEKSMKSFDKAAILEEIASTMASGDKKKGKNIAHDEHIMLENVRAFIHDNKGGHVKCSSYTSESGTVIPAVSVDTMQSLWHAADKLGLTAEKRLEAGGVSIAKMAMSLVHGKNREYSCPSVLVVCGPHLQGAQGINCARHLANHNADVTLFIPNFAKTPEILTTELKAFKETQGNHIANMKDLPEDPPDLIISALNSPADTSMPKQPWHKSIVSWVTTNKSSVLSIDPITTHTIRSKWSVITGLPLSYDNTNPGLLYLCDVGIPSKVFSSLGVEYISPFKDKFVVRLHNR